MAVGPFMDLGPVKGPCFWGSQNGQKCVIFEVCIFVQKITFFEGPFWGVSGPCS